MDADYYCTEAHKAAESHVEACLNALEAEEFAEELGVEPEADGPEMNGPFCGCLTCVVREALWKAYPIIVAGTKAGAFE